MMRRRDALQTIAGLILCPLCAPRGLGAEGVHWSYEGPEGPGNWGNLDAASAACSLGTQQSPIDIEGTVRAQLPPLEIAWGRNVDTIVNNGHTIQLNASEGGTATAGKDTYKLVQFHFHRPSEHLVEGKRYAMEAHFVHERTMGGLAVVGVFMTAGEANEVFKKIVANMPANAGPPAKTDAAIDPNGLLPADRDYYRYPGSLTTPPCSETVEWLLLTTPIEVAADDIAAFGKLYPMNARPSQKANRRTVLRSI